MTAAVTGTMTAPMTGTARVWDPDHGTLMAELKGHTGEVEAVAFSPDGRRAVTGSDDKTARVWTAARGRPGAHPPARWPRIYRRDQPR